MCQYHQRCDRKQTDAISYFIYCIVECKKWTVLQNYSLSKNLSKCFYVDLF